MSSNSKEFYAIRGGDKHGIYTEWYEAVNAGWHQKAPRGNAVKVYSRSDAEKFMAVKAFPENHITIMANEGQSWVQRQHFLVKINILGIAMILSFGFVFNILLKVQDRIGCDQTYMLNHMTCVHLNKLKVSIQEYYGHMVDVIFYYIIQALSVFTFWLTGFLNEK